MTVCGRSTPFCSVVSYGQPLSKPQYPLTGRLVVPLVYNIMPPLTSPASSSTGLWLLCPPSTIFSVLVLMHWFSSPSLSVSSALSANLREEMSMIACDWSRMYRSSPTGNAGARGTAIALLARIDKRLTVEYHNQSLSYKLGVCVYAYLRSRSRSPLRKLSVPPRYPLRLCQHLLQSFPWSRQCLSEGVRT